MAKGTVEIPDGDYCMNGTKPCIFARYTKKWQGYNCQIHNRILKGQEHPKKCYECQARCGQQEEQQHENGAE